MICPFCMVLLKWVFYAKQYVSLLVVTSYGEVYDCPVKFRFHFPLIRKFRTLSACKVYCYMLVVFKTKPTNHMLYAAEWAHISKKACLFKFQEKHERREPSTSSKCKHFSSLAGHSELVPVCLFKLRLIDVCPSCQVSLVLNTSYGLYYRRYSKLQATHGYFSIIIAFKAVYTEVYRLCYVILNY